MLTKNAIKDHGPKWGWPLLLLMPIILLSTVCVAQQQTEVKLEKMPADLETDFALSSLPPHLRKGAAVYLLDPQKGYYMARKGSNGFTCFVARTEWEWGFYSKDIATPESFDAEGTKTIFRVYQDVEAMRASGKFTATAIRDSVLARIRAGRYKAPTAGISYMLSPMMRTYRNDPGDNSIFTGSMPHYMFYAPYLTNADIGNIPGAPSGGPLVVNSSSKLLGDRKGPHGCIILAAGTMERKKILDDSKDLINRLVAYKPYFKIGSSPMHH